MQPNSASTCWSVAALAFVLLACSDAVRPTESTPVPPPRPPALARITGRVAFASTRDGSPWIYVADSTGVRRLVRGDEPAWSPDGTTIAFESAKGISLIGQDGTNERLVRAGGRQPSWSPDGERIAFTDGGLRVMQADGLAEALLVDDNFKQDGDAIYHPDWSMDGQRLAFALYDCCWMWPTEIYVVALGGSPPRKAMNGVDQNGGTTIYSHWSPAWSPDGRSIALIHYFALATIAVGTEDLKALGGRAAWESELDWSPDGKRLVFSNYNGPTKGWMPPSTGQLRIYVADLATGEVRQLIPEASAPVNRDYWDNHAVWSHAK